MIFANPFLTSPHAPCYIPNRMASLELKARCSDFTEAQSKALALTAQPPTHDSQRDTYFATPRGRLKLRQSTVSGALLIPYIRPDSAGPRDTDSIVLPVKHGDDTRRLLDLILGTRCEVHKERYLYLWRGVRIHLDRVRGLGDFIEFEAPYSGAATRESRDALDYLQAYFAVSPNDIVSGSYEDLMEALSRSGH